MPVCYKPVPAFRVISLLCLWPAINFYPACRWPLRFARPICAKPRRGKGFRLFFAKGNYPNRSLKKQHRAPILTLANRALAPLFRLRSPAPPFSLVFYRLTYILHPKISMSLSFTTITLKLLNLRFGDASSSCTKVRKRAPLLSDFASEPGMAAMV